MPYTYPPVASLSLQGLILWPRSDLSAVSLLEPHMLQTQTEVIPEPVQPEPLLQGQVVLQEPPFALLPSFSSSLADSMIPDSSSPVHEDFKSYQDLLRHMASALDIQPKLGQ